jgi:transposase-like protein
LPEVVQPFWAALQAGEFIADAAVASGTYRKQGTRWVAACGGVRPRRGRNLKGRCLTFAEREEIALARARGETMRAIARRLGRSPSTISRELKRNADRRGYRATTAHALAYDRASRPKPAKLATNLALRELVQDDLQRRFSPEQIAGPCRRPGSSRCSDSSESESPTPVGRRREGARVRAMQSRPCGPVFCATPVGMSEKDRGSSRRCRSETGGCVS